MTRMPFSAFSTVSFSVTLKQSFRRRMVNMPTTMPVDEIKTGYIREHQWPCRSSDAETRTNAAQEDSANEPKRSAPMPAMSPTLSPTLSAMQAGLRKSSSSRPYSFLPERSAPTSAALV